MRSLRVLTLAGAAVVMMLPVAHAADMPPLMQQFAPPPPDDFTSGWYLRGDVGVGIQSFSSFDHFQTNPAFVWPASWNVQQKGIGDSTSIGVGVGYQYNSWLRFDVTAEYRTTARIHTVGNYSGAADFCAGGGQCFDVYDGSHSAAVALANVYFDLGTWNRITPFVGVGVGVARNMVSDFWDLGLNSDGTTGRGFANNYAAYNFAWAVHAGLSYDVAPNLKIELAYRYLDMGAVRTGIVDCVGCGVGGPLAYYQLKDFTAQDIKLGLRWMLDTPAPPPPPPPLIRKG